MLSSQKDATEPLNRRPFEAPLQSLATVPKKKTFLEDTVSYKYQLLSLSSESACADH